MVAEPDVLKRDAAVRHFGHGVVRRGDVGCLVEQLDGALAGGAGYRDHDEDHREAHQAHEDLRRVGDQAQQLAGRKAERRVAAAGDDGPRAEPGDQDDGGVHAQLHQRGVPGEALLRLFEVLIDALGNRVEFLFLVVLAHERLDDADAVQVFLHDAVEPVVGAENALEDRVRPRHDEVKAQREDRDDREEDQRELRVDREGGDEREDHHQRAAHRHADDHLVGVLQVRHVRRQAGDDAGRGELVNIGKGEVLHLVEHVVAQVPRKAARGFGGEFAGGDAAEQLPGGRKQQHEPHFHNIVHVAGVDAVVDEVGHQHRDDHLKNDLSADGDHGEDGVPLLLADAPHQLSNQVRPSFAAFCRSMVAMSMLSCMRCR